MRALVRLPLLALVAGCGFLRDPVALDEMSPQFGVFSVLQGGSDTASVLVVRFPTTTDDGRGWDGVAGATVRLVTGTDTIALVEEPAASDACIALRTPVEVGGCYRGVVAGGVTTGATYHLVADVPGFGRINGTATIPGAPTILSPVAGTRLRLGQQYGDRPTMHLGIEAPPGVARIEALLVPNDPARECEAYLTSALGGWRLAMDPEDARDVTVGYFAYCRSQSGGQPTGELPVILRASTFDAGYARFAENVFDDSPQALRQEAARVGIDRGLGYFIGSGVAEVELVLEPYE